MTQPIPATAKTWAKICGLTKLEQAQECAALGAWALGLNFWPLSKRYLAPEIARTWMAHLPADLRRVGVFVNPTLAEVLAVGDIIHVAQLHGEESPEFCRQLAEQGIRVWKAFGVKDRASLERIGQYRVEGILLDAYCPGEYGGSGKSFDWELAREVVAAFPDTLVILSGGLTAENVGQAVAQVRPYAVDVASGVEASPGVKDMALVQRFITAAATPENAC